MAGIYEPNDVEAQFCYGITMLFGMLTPILNPILYSMFNENVRQKLEKKCPGFLSFWAAQKQNPSAEELSLNPMGNGTQTTKIEGSTNELEPTGYPDTNDTLVVERV